jgi:ABC-type proline/glycine betaine transport system permease subunit
MKKYFLEKINFINRIILPVLKKKQCPSKFIYLMGGILFFFGSH